MLSDGASSFMFDRRNICWNTNIGDWNQRRTLLQRSCTGTLNDVLGFDMLIVRQLEQVGHPPCLLCLVRNVDVTFDYCGLDLCCLEVLLDGIYLVRDTEAWSREFELKCRQRHHARGPKFVGWHSLGMFCAAT